MDARPGLLPGASGGGVKPEHPIAVFTPTNRTTDAIVTLEAIRGNVYVGIENAGPHANEDVGFTLDPDEATRLAELFTFIAKKAKKQPR